MIELNKPSEWKASYSPLSSFQWNTGNILFDYQRYDKYDNCAGELDNFQSYPRVLVVIGLVNYPELGAALGRIEEDLEFYSRRFPYVVLRRLFVFNYSFGSVNSDRSIVANKDPSTIEIFPPAIAYEGGNIIDMHLKEVMGNVAIQVILSLEKQILHCVEYYEQEKNYKLPHNVLLSCYEDRADESLNDASKKQKKKLIGRIHKWTGDLAMQLCSPGDAIDHYATAMLECRSQGDFLWLAGACEGYAASILLLLQLNMPPEDFLGQNLKPSAGLSTEASAIRVAEERAVEALGIYSRSPGYKVLEVQCAMRVARLYSKVTWPDREQRVAEGVMRAASISGLDNQTVVEVLMESALLCNRIAMRRRYPWLLYLALLHHSESTTETIDPTQQLSVAHALLSACAAQYGVEVRTGSTNAEQSTSSRYLYAANPDLSWNSIKRILLSQLAQFAREKGDVPGTISALSALLRLMAENEVLRKSTRRLWIGDGSSASNSPALSIVVTPPAKDTTSSSPSPNSRPQRPDSSVVSSTSRTLEEALMKRPSQYLQHAASLFPDSSSINGAESDDGSGSVFTNSRETLANIGDAIRQRDRKNKLAIQKLAPFLQVGTGPQQVSKRRIKVESVRGAGMLTAESILLFGECTAEVQDLTLRLFESQCTLVPPPHPAYLSMLPEVLSVRPMMKAGAALPRQLHRSGPGSPLKDALESGKSSSKNIGGSSALFYDPFAARAQKMRDDAAVTEVLWPIGETGAVVVVLRNPLAVALRLSDVRVVVGGGPCSVSPVSVLLPAAARAVEITINVCATAVGDFQILGLEYHVGNVTHTVPLDERGCPRVHVSESSRPWQYPRRVTSPTKLVSAPNAKRSHSAGVLCSTVTVTTRGCVLRLQPSWTTKTCSLYSGEVREVTVQITNTSSLNISDYRIRVISDGFKHTLAPYDLLSFHGPSPDGGPRAETFSTPPWDSERVVIRADVTEGEGGGAMGVVEANGGQRIVKLLLAGSTRLHSRHESTGDWNVEGAVDIAFDSICSDDIISQRSGIDSSPTFYRRETLTLNYIISAGLWVSSVMAVDTSEGGLVQRLSKCPSRGHHIRCLEALLGAEGVLRTRILPNDALYEVTIVNSSPHPGVLHNFTRHSPQLPTADLDTSRVISLGDDLENVSIPIAGRSSKRVVLGVPRGVLRAVGSAGPVDTDHISCVRTFLQSLQWSLFEHGSLLAVTERRGRLLVRPESWPDMPRTTTDECLGPPPYSLSMHFRRAPPAADPPVSAPSGPLPSGRTHDCMCRQFHQLGVAVTNLSSGAVSGQSSVQVRLAVVPLHDSTASLVSSPEPNLGTLPPDFLLVGHTLKLLTFPTTPPFDVVSPDATSVAGRADCGGDGRLCGMDSVRGPQHGILQVLEHRVQLSFTRPGSHAAYAFIRRTDDDVWWAVRDPLIIVARRAGFL